MQGIIYIRSDRPAQPHEKKDVDMKMQHYNEQVLLFTYKRCIAPNGEK